MRIWTSENLTSIGVLDMDRLCIRMADGTDLAETFIRRVDRRKMKFSMDSARMDYTTGTAGPSTKTVLVILGFGAVVKSMDKAKSFCLMAL